MWHKPVYSAILLKTCKVQVFRYSLLTEYGQDKRLQISNLRRNSFRPLLNFRHRHQRKHDNFRCHFRYVDEIVWIILTIFVLLTKIKMASTTKILVIMFVDEKNTVLYEPWLGDHGSDTGFRQQINNPIWVLKFYNHTVITNIISPFILCFFVYMCVFVFYCFCNCSMYAVIFSRLYFKGEMLLTFCPAQFNVTHCLYLSDYLWANKWWWWWWRRITRISQQHTHRTTPTLSLTRIQHSPWFNSMTILYWQPYQLHFEHWQKDTELQKKIILVAEIYT